MCPNIIEMKIFISKRSYWDLDPTLEKKWICMITSQWMKSSWRPLNKIRNCKNYPITTIIQILSHNLGTKSFIKETRTIRSIISRGEVSHGRKVKMVMVEREKMKKITKVKMTKSIRDLERTSYEVTNGITMGAILVEAIIMPQIFFNGWSCKGKETINNLNIIKFMR